MTDTPTDAWSMTPEQATTALAEMTATYRATQPTSPQDQLNAFAADAEKWAKLQGGNVAARREFDDLVTKVIGVDDVAAAMGNNPSAITTGELREMADTAKFLRELGVGDDVIKQTLSGDKVSRAEFETVKRWREEALGNADWTAKYLKGDAAAVRQMTLATIVLTSVIKEAT